MNRTLVYLPLLGAGFILAACASNQPKAPDNGADTNTGIETNSQGSEANNPTKTMLAGKAIIWDKSDTGSSNGQVKSETNPSARPNLSGFWVLNEELSDDPQEKIKKAMQQARNSKGGSSSGRGVFESSGRGGGMKGGGRRNGMKGSGSSGDRGKKNGSRDSSFREIQALFSASENLLLTHEDPMLLIVTDDGRRQRIYTDNRGASISATGGMNQKVTTAGWEQDILVVETNSDSGPQLIQQYKLISGPDQLIVSTAIQPTGSSQPIVVNRVYEQASARTHTDKRVAN